MAETQTKSIMGQDAERAQEKKRRLEPAPVTTKVLTNESIQFPGILGVSAMELPLEEHAAFLGDPRFSHSASNAQKAGLVTELQQNYGNAYVERVVGLIQTKKDEHLPEEEPDLAGIARTIAQEEGSRQPLEPSTRIEMEASFGKDCGPVSFHADVNADRLSTELGAKAFTTGNDIFREGAYQPSSETGKELLGHGLTHVAQQESGTQAGGVSIGQVGDSFEQQAAWAGRAVNGGGPVSVKMAAAAPALQRQVAAGPAGAEMGEAREEVPEEEGRGEVHVSVSRIYLRYSDDDEFTLSFDEACALSLLEGSQWVAAKPTQELKSLGYVKSWVGCWVNQSWKPYTPTLKTMAHGWINKAGHEMRTKSGTGELKIDLSGLDASLEQIHAKVDAVIGEGPPSGHPVGVHKKGVEILYYTHRMYRQHPSDMWKIIQYEELAESHIIRLQEMSGPTPEAGKSETAAEEVPKAGKLVISGFKFGKEELPTEGIGDFQDFAKRKDKANVVITSIAGHTDATGSEEYNIGLSRERAEAVEAALEAAGFEKAKLVLGLGEAEATKPASAQKKVKAVDRKVVIDWELRPPEK